jgi:hypothetical protein
MEDDDLTASIEAAIEALPTDLVPFDLGCSTVLSLPPWPPLLAGAWYERGKGWGWYGADGEREQVPVGIIVDAGLPTEVNLPDGLNTLFLHGQPFRNLIPRTGTPGAS